MMKTLSRWLTLLLCLCMAVCLTACGAAPVEEPPPPVADATTDTDIEPVPATQSDSEPIVEPESIEQRGTTEVYTREALQLQVSNVREARTETVYEYLDDAKTQVAASWDVTTYVVYPGAVATVLNADMAEKDAPDGQTLSFKWVFYTNNGEPLYIVDGMKPVPLEDIACVGAESVAILVFEPYQGE